MKGGKRWWWLLEQAQATLPLLAVGALAAFTWWLVQSTPDTSGPARAKPVSVLPDYELREARVARFDADGRLRAVVDGQAMRHYAENDRLEIDTLVLSARDEVQSVHAVANRGEALGATEVVSLSGGAKVVAKPGVPVSGASAPAMATSRSGLQGPLRFSGESLRIDLRQHQVQSDQPLTLTQDHSVIHAQSLRHDDVSGVTDLGGRVSGQYVNAGR